MFKASRPGIAIMLLTILFYLLAGSHAAAQNACEDSAATPSNPGNATESPGWSDGYKFEIKTSGDTISRGSYIEVWVESAGQGSPPYSWSIEGEGFHFNDPAGPTTEQTNSNYETLLVWADNTACGSVIIKVRDNYNGIDVTAHARQPNNGVWVLIEDKLCGTVIMAPNGRLCSTDNYSIQGAYRYLDRYIGCDCTYTPVGNCSKYPSTPYERDYCYAPGYQYSPVTHNGIDRKQKWKWDCN